MNLVDKVKKLAGENAEKIEGAIEKAAKIIDDKTGGKYHDKIDRGAGAAKGFVGKVSEEEGGPQDPPSRTTP